MTSSFEKGERADRALQIGQDKAASDSERREGDRHKTVYLPCCVRNETQCTVGLIRNISEGGVMIETAISGEVGSEVSYFFDGMDDRRSRIAWREGNRVGLQHLDEDEQEEQGNLVGGEREFPPRAVRVPTSLTARVWFDGQRKEIGIANISQSGMMAYGMPPIQQGRLVTVNILGQDFPNASIRWWSDGSVGIKFEHQLTLAQLGKLLDKVDAGGSEEEFAARRAAAADPRPAKDQKIRRLG